MIILSIVQTEPHKANAIDKHAIHNLIPHLQWEIEHDILPISFDELTDESNYRILKVEGYENIVFYNQYNKAICETVQPIDRENNKLFPVQKIELQIHYKRY